MTVDISYSDIISLRMDSLDKSIIYPNPASKTVFVSSEKENFLEIMDLNGRILLTQFIYEGENNINLDNLPNGILIFKARDNIQKIIKH